MGIRSSEAHPRSLFLRLLVVSGRDLNRETTLGKWIGSDHTLGTTIREVDFVALLEDSHLQLILRSRRDPVPVMKVHHRLGGDQCNPRVPPLLHRDQE